ncbi:hypothetical protein [Burkholderia cenocepacia]|uniref:hypothetical protein n=1 Tax=Burkholderia cenocepacia TaxID=95486 RepID=UPI000F5ADE46|nr:hypothetical protein [Burkholderia cenocepacia]
MYHSLSKEPSPPQSSTRLDDEGDPGTARNIPLSSASLLERMRLKSDLEHAKKMLQFARQLTEKRPLLTSEVLVKYFNDSSPEAIRWFGEQIKKIHAYMMYTSVKRNFQITKSDSIGARYLAKVEKNDISQSLRNYIESQQRLADDHDGKELAALRREKKNDYRGQINDKFITINMNFYGKVGGADERAVNLIHEFSHAALNTYDYVYAGRDFSDPKFRSLKSPDQSAIFRLGRGKLLSMDEEKQQRTLGDHATLHDLFNATADQQSAFAKRNADSLAYAIQAAYLAQK